MTVGIALSLRGLGRRFGDTVAVDALSLDVPWGTLFGIVGPDGAGKTTTLRMLAGLIRPSSGTARLAGIDVVSDPGGVKPHIAYMAQRFGLYEDLTVAENLAFYADLYGVPRAERATRLERLYGFSGLGPFENRLSGALSGGMKQKLSLSCCLIHRPKIMLLDEPTFGVDPVSRRELWMILHEMVADGVTVVLSTSYLEEAERCDRVVLLDQGQILALGDPPALQETLSGQLWAVSTDRIREARDVLRSDTRIGNAALFGEKLHVVCPSAQLVRESLDRRGVSVRGVDAIEPSLEDVFIRLVDRARETSNA